MACSRRRLAIYFYTTLILCACTSSDPEVKLGPPSSLSTESDSGAEGLPEPGTTDAGTGSDGSDTGVVVIPSETTGGTTGADTTGSNATDTTGGETTSTTSGDTSDTTGGETTGVFDDPVVTTAGETTGSTTSATDGESTGTIGSETIGITDGESTGTIGVETIGITDGESTGTIGVETAGTTGGETTGTTGGETTGTVGGETAGTTGGETTGATGGETTGTVGGVTAGATDGETTGTVVGETVGVTAGNTAGTTGGETTGTSDDGGVIPTEIQITFSNLSLYQPFSPLVVVIHHSDWSILEVAEKASAGVANFSETGQNTLLINEILADSDDLVSDVLVAQSSSDDSGYLYPGKSTFLDISVRDNSDVVTILGKIACTNDAFVGLFSIPLNTESYVEYADVYDAGTEVNIPENEHWIELCGGSGANLHVAEEDVVKDHEGQTGSENGIYDFQNADIVLEVGVDFLR